MEDSCGGDNRHVADSPAHPDILYPVQLQDHCVSTTHSNTVISEITAGILGLFRFGILHTCLADFCLFITSITVFIFFLLFVQQYIIFTILQ